MTLVKLVTASFNDEVATVKVPPMKEKAAIIKWNGRMFIETEDPTVYREGLMYEAHNTVKNYDDNE